MRLTSTVVLPILATVGLLCEAFVPQLSSRRLTTQMESSVPKFSPSDDFFLTPEEVDPLIRVGKGDKEKVINVFGLRCALASLITGPVWAATMSILQAIYKVADDFDPDRSIYDSTGKIWAKSWLTMTDSYPTITGDVDRLKEGHGPCLYVANHASWLDIPVLCTVLDPVFKFIAKGELRSVPCIGQQLDGVSTSFNVSHSTPFLANALAGKPYLD